MKDKECSSIIGSCNGLICLEGGSYSFYDYQEYWLRLWNPATKEITPKFGYFQEDLFSGFKFHNSYKFNFGCDNSTGIYKAVASRYNRHQRSSNVRILSLGDNLWRDIESFLVVPLDLDMNVYFKSTLNWLAVQNVLHYGFDNMEDIGVEQFGIVLLDLRTETYNQYLLPRDFDEVPTVEPTIGVLGDCLCFSYCYKESDLVIWHMKKFGVEDSWTRFLRISYNDLQIDYSYDGFEMEYDFNLVPLFLSGDGNTLILRSTGEAEAILYNWRDNTVGRTKVNVNSSITDCRTNVRTDTDACWNLTMGYVESLVSIC